MAQNQIGLEATETKSLAEKLNTLLGQLPGILHERKRFSLEYHR
jgi:trehalose-6-phosphatase